MTLNIIIYINKKFFELIVGIDCKKTGQCSILQKNEISGVAKWQFSRDKDKYTKEPPTIIEAKKLCWLAITYTDINNA